MGIKKKNEDDDLDFIPDNNNRPLTEEENRKIQLKKLISELRKRHINQPIVITKSGEAKPANLLTLQEQQEEIFKCGLDPIYYIETYLTVFDQTKGDGGQIVPFKLFPFQKDLILAYMKNKENIANKYRQAGVSTTTCAYIAWYVTFTKNRYVAVIADKLETARDELMSDIVDFIENCPSFVKPTLAKVGGKDSMGHKKYNNGSQVKAFAATKLRGPTPTLVFWDEAAWTEKGEKFWESAGAAVRNTGGRVIFVSTPNGLDPIFYKTFNSSVTTKARGEKPYVNAIELWWYNDPRYQGDPETGVFDLEWIKNEGKDTEERIADEHWPKEKRAEMVKKGYSATSTWFERAKAGYNGDNRRLAQELLCSFLGSGDNFINEEFIKRIEDKEQKQPLRTEYNDKFMYIYEDPIPSEKYVMALDAASGYGEDFSTLIMLRVSEVLVDQEYLKNGEKKVRKRKRTIAEQVAEYCGKVTPQQLADMAYYYGVKYNHAYCVVDVSGGYGVSTMESLKMFGYTNIHYSDVQHKPSRDRLNVYVKTVERDAGNGQIKKVDLIPGFMIGSNRPLVLQEMERCIRLEDVIIRSVRLTSEFKTFITVENKNRLADHKRTYHDDLIMGLAIGLYVINCEMSREINNVEKIKSMLNAIMVVNDNSHIRENEEKMPSADDYVVHRQNPFGANAWVFGNKYR